LGDYLAWLLADDLGRDKLVLLVLCMLSASVLSAHLRWRLRVLASAQGKSQRGGWARRWLGAFWQLCLSVGIPLGVLMRGALVREMGVPVTLVEPAGWAAADVDRVGPWLARGLAWMGLIEAQGAVRLGAGLAVGFGALLVLSAVWVWYARAVLASEGLAFEVLPAVPWWDALRQALLAQIPWSFYRGFVLSVVPARAQAALLGLALISIPWALDPRHRQDLFSLRGYRVVLEWLLALSTVLVSLATNQLWFLVAMHCLWVWVSGRLLAHLAERFLQESPSTTAS
jgi:hypothetical protein